MIENLQYTLLKSEEGIYFVEYQDNYFRISIYTNELLNKIKEGYMICEISKEMNVPDLEIEEVLNNIFKILTQKKDRKKIKKISTLLNSAICDRLGMLLSFLLKENRMIIMSVVSVLMNIFFYLNHSNIQLFYSNITIIHYLICMMFVMFIHELGHISAAYSFGLKGLKVKLGVFAIWPLLYVDLNKQVLLQPRKRIKISLGGVYFQSIFSIVVIIIDSMVKEDVLILLLNMNNFLILLNLIPFFILDGYWIYSDIIGVYNLNTKSDRLIKRSIRNFRELIDAPLKISLYAIVRFIFTCLIGLYVIKMIYYRFGFAEDMMYLLSEGINVLLIIRFIWWAFPFILLITYLQRKKIWKIFKK
jgi:putative peptide zinc metalloprotease protein